jgi:hypothetical protein
MDAKKPKSYRQPPAQQAPPKPAPSAQAHPAYKSSFPHDGAPSGIHRFAIAGGAALLAIAGLAIIAFAIFLLAQPQAPPVVNIVSNNTTITNMTSNTNGTWNSSICGDDCVFNLALESGNYSICAKMSANGSDKCYSIFSFTTLDACVKMKDVQARKSCLSSLAESLGNSSICAMLPDADSQRICNDKLKPPCAEFAGEEHDLCLALRNNDSAYCTGKECAIGYGKAKRNSSACGVLGSEAERLACISIIDIKDACANSSVGAVADYCYAMLAAGTDQYFYCGYVKSGLYKYQCLLAKAEFVGNASACDGNDLEYKFTCYREYSLAKGDLGGCLAIKELYAEASRDGCIYDFATAFSNPSACNELENMNSRTTCYAAIILAKDKNLSVAKCAGVQLQVWMDKCFSAYAMQIQEPKVCGYITDNDAAKEQCLLGAGSQ